MPRGRDWFMTTFAAAVGAIGHTLLVLQPWQAPAALTRSWCLWEVFVTLQAGARLSVALCGREAEAYDSALRARLGEVTAALGAIDVGRASASDGGDEDAIRTAVYTSPGRFEFVNARVKAAVFAALDLALVPGAQVVIQDGGAPTDGAPPPDALRVATVMRRDGETLTVRVTATRRGAACGAPEPEEVPLSRVVAHGRLYQALFDARAPLCVPEEELGRADQCFASRWAHPQLPALRVALAGAAPEMRDALRATRTTLPPSAAAALEQMLPRRMAVLSGAPGSGRSRLVIAAAAALMALAAREGRAFRVLLLHGGGRRPVHNWSARLARALDAVSPGEHMPTWSPADKPSLAELWAAPRCAVVGPCYPVLRLLTGGARGAAPTDDTPWPPFQLLILTETLNYHAEDVFFAFDAVDPLSGRIWIVGDEHTDSGEAVSTLFGHPPRLFSHAGLWLRAAGGVCMLREDHRFSDTLRAFHARMRGAAAWPACDAAPGDGGTCSCRAGRAPGWDAAALASGLAPEWARAALAPDVSLVAVAVPASADGSRSRDNVALAAATLLRTLRAAWAPTAGPFEERVLVLAPTHRCIAEVGQALARIDAPGLAPAQLTRPGLDVYTSSSSGADVVIMLHSSAVMSDDEEVPFVKKLAPKALLRARSKLILVTDLAGDPPGAPPEGDVEELRQVVLACARGSARAGDADVREPERGARLVCCTAADLAPAAAPSESAD